MVNCPNCSKALIHKEGAKKFCAQIGNPELAIVETMSPEFCECCNEYFLTTGSLVEAIIQIKSKMNNPSPIASGVYC
ncbi:MAG: hypothetical protein AABX17_03040 [Nanoarchaeota archaeon]